MNYCGGHGDPVFDNETDYKEWLNSWGSSVQEDKFLNLESTITDIARAINILKLKLDNVYQAIHFLGIDIDDSNIHNFSKQTITEDEKPEYMEIPTEEEMKEIYKKLNNDLTNEEKAKLKQIFIKKEN